MKQGTLPRPAHSVNLRRLRSQTLGQKHPIGEDMKPVRRGPKSKGASAYYSHPPHCKGWTLIIGPKT